MSCDSLARHAISTLGMGLPAEDHTRLQAVYDLPPKLQPGEKGAEIRRAGRTLVLRLRAAGADIPDHMDLDKPTSKAALKFGRLAQELEAAKLRQRKARQPREPQRFETLAAAMESLPPDMPMMDLPSGGLRVAVVPASALAERVRQKGQGQGPYEVRDETYQYGKFRRTTVVYVGPGNPVVIYRESVD